MLLLHFYCLITALTQKQLIGVQIVLVENSYQCEWLPLEYMQTRVYYNPYTDTQTHMCVSVNAAFHMLLIACSVTISHWNKFMSVK